MSEQKDKLREDIADYIQSNFPLIVLTKEGEYEGGASELANYIVNLIEIPDTVTNDKLRQELIDWVMAYKDAAERNALAENPDESADYLITLIGPLIEEAKKQERKDIGLELQLALSKVVNKPDFNEYRLSEFITVSAHKLIEGQALGEKC